MNVSVIGLRPGGPDAPRTNAGGETSPGRSLHDARVETGAAEPRRRAWFDFNGDGKIEDLNPLYGGDGTLLGFKDAPRARVREAPDRQRLVAQVVVDHARDAYQRYSQTEQPSREDAPKASVA